MTIVPTRTVSLASAAACRQAQEIADAEDEFPGAKGFRQIIVSAQFQAQHSIDLTGLGRQHDDENGRRSRVSPEHPADFQAVDLGEHDIQDDDRRQPLAGLAQCFLAIGGGNHIKTGALQVEPDQFQRVWLVINNQDFLFQLAVAVTRRAQRVDAVLEFQRFGAPGIPAGNFASYQSHRISSPVPAGLPALQDSVGIAVELRLGPRPVLQVWRERLVWERQPVRSKRTWNVRRRGGSNGQVVNHGQLFNGSGHCSDQSS